ncbi:MAG: sulfatase [Thermoanaerobaculia bacterium]
MACLAWWPSAAALADSGRPNVFLIVIDTLRADHLSCYGYGRETSPNIDRLAAQGILYEQSISAASWTFPAHASLFTGLFPRDHGATSQTRTLEASFDTLAELLKTAGYRTAGFSNNVWTHDASGLKQGFEEFREMWHQQVVEDKGISFDDPAYDMGAALTTEEIFGWLDGAGDGERPFFVFVNYFEPHLPYRPTQPFDDEFLPSGADPRQVRKLRSFYSPREYAYILDIPWVRVEEKELEILTALYDGEIAYVDSILGVLVDGLRSRGLLDDTLLVITSDHGEHLGEHHMLDHKLSLYDPLLRVPLILWNPKRIPAGVRVESQVQAHDVFGTILDFGGVPRESAPRLPFADAGERSTFAELAYPRIFLDAIDRELPGLDSRTRRFARSLKAVRGPRYKLIAGSDGRTELYDIGADPGESHDLADELPEVVAELKKTLDAFKSGSLPERQ